MLQPACSGALHCCECGTVVGTEGAQRGTLLLPCQHVLHLGCVEYIKRRGKLIMGMDSADVVQIAEDESLTKLTSMDSLQASGSASWTRQVRGHCSCPACSMPIANFIPLYVRSEDDAAAAAPQQNSPSSSSAALSRRPTAEEDYKRVQAAQKRVLLRLRGLCEQRRRMTELTHTCASLHEQRARYLAEVEKEERCFPGLISGADKVSGGSGSRSASATASNSKTTHDASVVSSLPIEHMGITELELYMAQITPSLLRTQAELRKERQLVERRTKRLNALRAHYHSTKELRALDAEIAARQAHPHGRSGEKRTVAHKDNLLAHEHSTSHEESEASLNEVAQHQRRGTAPSTQSSSSEQQQRQQQQPPQQRQDHLRQTAADAVTPVLGPLPDTPVRKKVRGEAAIDVDDMPPAEVVEVLSSDEDGEYSDATDKNGSDAHDHEVTIVDNDDDADLSPPGTDADTLPAHEGGVAWVEGSDANAFDAPYLIPCYVRPSAMRDSAGATPAGQIKTPRSALTANHLRMLPRREDRLWQPSLQF